MTLARELKSVVARHLDTAPAGDILKIVSALCVEPPAAAAPPTIARSVLPRFTKIGESGEKLPDSATEWVAVYDSLHDLTWTRGNVGTKRLNWKAAGEACEALELAGGDGWHLPTVPELLSLVDYSRAEPAIDTTVFACESNWYWSSTLYAGSPSVCAWNVYFNGGNSVRGSQSYEGFVRAVRAGQSLEFGF